MAQRIFLQVPKHKILYVIDDSDLSIYEFQDFFEEVSRKLQIDIDGYSGTGISLDKNRKFAQMLTQKLYEIEDSFPESKISVYDNKKLISKKVTIVFFERLLKILEEAFKLKCDIGLEGE